MNATKLAVAMTITVLGQVIYHSVAKAVSANRSPWELISVAYLTAFIIVTLLGWRLDQIEVQSAISTKNILPAMILGLAVSCVELGYIYAYRANLPVTIGAFSVLALTTVILIPVGSAFYGEGVTLKQAVGIALASVGLWLMLAR